MTQIPWPDSEPDGDPTRSLGIPDERTLDVLLRLHTTIDAPRVFALCEVESGWRGASIVAWGMAFAERAVVYLPGERSFGSFSSPERAAQVFGMGRHVRLVWPDDPPVPALTPT